MLGRLTRERTDAGGAEDEAREEGRAEEEEVGTARYESSSDSSSLRRLCAEVKRDKVERCFCRSQGGSSVFCDRKRKKLDKEASSYPLALDQLLPHTGDIDNLLVLIRVTG